MIENASKHGAATDGLPLTATFGGPSRGVARWDASAHPRSWEPRRNESVLSGLIQEALLALMTGLLIAIVPTMLGFGPLSRWILPIALMTLAVVAAGLLRRAVSDPGSALRHVE